MERGNDDIELMNATYFRNQRESERVNKIKNYLNNIK